MHPRFVLVLTEYFSRAYAFCSFAFTQNTHTFSFILQSFKDTWYWSQKYFAKRIQSLLHLLENSLSARVIQIYGEKKNKTDLAAPASASSALQAEFFLSLVEESCTKQTALLWFSCFLSSKPPSQPLFSSKQAMALLPTMWKSGFFLVTVKWYFHTLMGRSKFL